MEKKQDVREKLKKLGNYNETQLDNIMKGLEELDKPENQKYVEPTHPELEKKLRALVGK